jgi:Chaperone of endosialidase
LTVFDITTDSYWYSNGAAWVNMATISSASPWLTSGNDINNSNTGNIGIGTNNPSYKLDVLTNGTFSVARFKSKSSYCAIDIDAADGDAGIIIKNNGVSQWLIRNRPSDDYFEIFEFGGGGSRMVAQKGTGNIGIGVDNPDTRLHVQQPANGLGLRLTNNAWDWDIYTSNGAGLNFNYNGVNKGYISSVNGSYVATSDARLKKDINKMPSVLEKVMALQAKTYKYLDNKESDMASSGFIAQEVMPLFPDLVSDFQRPSKDSTDTTVYHGLNYAGFSVVAIKAIQEQQQQIETLKAQMQKMQTAIDALGKK